MKKISWFLLTLAALFLAVGVWLLSEAYMSSQWPTVEGEIVEAKVAARIGQPGDTLRRHVEYYIKVNYTYQIDNQWYKKSRYSLGSGDTVQSGFYDKSEARHWLQQSPWQVGRKLLVHVDPADPDNTVLSSGINWGTWMPMVMAVLFFTLGYLLQWLPKRTLNFNSGHNDPPEKQGGD